MCVLYGRMEGRGGGSSGRRWDIILHLRSTREPGLRNRYSDSLRTGRSGDRIPVGARFFTPVQTGSEAHLASYTMGTRSFPEMKLPGRGVDNPPH